MDTSLKNDFHYVCFEKKRQCFEGFANIAKDLVSHATFSAYLGICK